MVTSWANSEESCRSRLSGFNEINGRHEETRTPDLYRVKVAVRQPVIDSKGVNNRRNRQNRNTRRNLLPNCYQNMASGFGAESWGIGPFTLHLNNLMFACRVTCALRVLALPQKTTSALATDISPRLVMGSRPFGSFASDCGRPASNRHRRHLLMRK